MRRRSPRSRLAKADPGSNAVDEVDARVARAQRVAGARDQIAARRFDALRVSLSECGGELAELAAAEQREAEDALRHAFDALAARLAALSRAGALTTFARDGRWKQAPVTPMVRVPAGEAPVTQIVEMLRTALLPEQVDAPPLVAS